MATDFTQDTVLTYIQSCGGSVKNSDLLLHFRDFIRDHADRDRNRELFKKFVNSVATVKQVDGVSHVVLRKKFRGHVPGGGEGGSSGKNPEPSPKNAALSPAVRAEKPRQKAQQREGTTPAPPGVTADKTILPAAGIMLNNNNNVETNFNLKKKEQQVISTTQHNPGPAAAQVSGGPAAAQVSGRPAALQVSGGPAAAHVSGRPAALQVSGGPGALQVSGGPAAAQVSGRPAALQVSGGPEAAHVSGRPAALQVSGGPGAAQVSGRPGAAQVPGRPAALQVSGGPAAAQVSGRPAAAQVSGGPAAAQVSGGPAAAQVTGRPAALQVSGGPAVAQVPGRPAAAQVPGRPAAAQVPGRPAAAQVTGGPAATQVETQISELKSPSVSEPPAQDQNAAVGQHRVSPGLPPGVTPVVTAVRHQGGTSQQIPEPTRGRQASLQPAGGLHQEPPLHPVSLHTQVAPRRFRHRQSYKSAVSCDEDEEEEEEVSMRPGSAGGAWPLSVPLGDMGRAISASSPCFMDPPQPPSVVSSSSSSSERMPPKIYIQNVKGEMLPPGGPDWTSESGAGQRRQWTGPGLEPGSVPGGSTFPRRSLPLEAEHYRPSPEVAPHHDVHMDRRYLQPAGGPLEPRQGPNQSQRLSSSHSSVFSPSSDAGLSNSDWPSSGSPRGSGWNSSYEDLQARTGKIGGESTILEVLQRAQRTKLESVTRDAEGPWPHSTGRLHHDQEATWHRSTGDLYDEEAASSDGSTSSPPLRRRPTVARRLSSQLRSRMCRSLGADLDQLLQEEERGGGGGSEAARLNRLHLISSSLSLRYDLSSSSLSSCSTPPRCHSLADLVEGEERKGGRRSLPTASSSTAHPEGPSKESLVPLEPREHAWLVKGAAGAWPDIYSLFREDSSLLNRRDFISGFTVLHWIAKHGDHRVLNTLWYGVQKAGLTFDINARSTCGHTPLHIAAIHGHKNIMRLLVSKFNADVMLRDTAGKKAWQYLSGTMSTDVFQLLGAPSQAAGKGEVGVGRVDSSWKPERHHRRRRRHHFSTASSGQRPLTISGTTKVKRSSSIAAFLKHKSLQRFHGHQSDASI